MANEKIIFDTEVKVGSSVGSVKSLKAELRAVTNELATLEEGSQAFVKAAQKAGELKDKIGDIKNVVSAFNPEAKFQAFAGAVGIAANGFAALQGGMALFGSESENLNKVIAKTQGAIALATGLNGLLGMKDAFNVLKLTSIASFNAIRVSAVATFSTLKGAMAATGIGALVVALGYLVTKFIETSAANEEATKKEKEYTEQTKKTKEATDEKVKSIELEIIAIQNKTNAAGATLIYAKAEKAALEETIAKEEEKIKKQNESGEALSAYNFVDINGIKEKLKVKNAEIENLQIISDATKKFEKIKKDADDAEKLRLKNIDDAKDREKKIFESNEYWANESLKSKNKYGKDSKEFDEYWAKEAAKSKKEYDKIALDKHIVTLKQNSTNERLSFEDRLAAYRQLAKEQVITATQLKDAELAIEKEKEEKYKQSLEKRLSDIKIFTDAATTSLNIISNINEIEANKQKAKYDDDKANLNTQLENKLISRQQYDDKIKALDSQADNDARKAFEENKKIQIAMALIQTFSGAAAAFASAAANPIAILGPAYPFIQAGLATVAGLSNVAKIQSTQYKSSSTSGGGGGGAAPSAPRIPQSISGTRLGGNSEVTTTGKSTTGKVIVVETDITNTQNKVKNIIRKATIK